MRTTEPAKAFQQFPPLYLSPMVTLTHAGFRCLVAELGECDRYYTEMISAEAIVAQSEFRPWYLDLRPDPGRTMYQFLFRDVAAVGAVVAEIAATGALGVDLNMACSAPHIVRGGGGIAWMKRPGEAQRAVAAARAAAPSLRLALRTGATSAACRGSSTHRLQPAEG